MPDSRAARAKILEGVAELCHRLPLETMESICDRLQELDAGATRDALVASLASIPEPGARAEISDLLDKWLLENPEASGREFAFLLRGAAAADRAARARQDLELVWTGPSPPNSAFRRTEQALLEVIEAAQEELWVVSFASYNAPGIKAALLDAAERGIQIRLVLESKEDSEGALTLSALQGLGSQLADRSTVYIWPREKRPTDASDRRGVLHAKCAVADGSVLFVSSANLTGAAMRLNMEMGVLIRGSVLPRRTSDHLRWLVESGILRAAPGT